MTVGIVIVGHGGYPEGLRSAAELIMGPQDSLETVSFRPGESPEVLAQRYQEVFEYLAPCDEVLVLADLAGGSPFTVVAPYVSGNKSRRLVAGANVGMLLDVLTRREELPVSELAEAAVQAGTTSVTTLEQFLS